MGNSVLTSGIVSVSPTRPFRARFRTANVGRRRLLIRIHGGVKSVVMDCRTSGPRVGPVPRPTGTTGGPGSVTSVRRLFLAKRRLRRCHRTACGPVSCCSRTLHHRPNSVQYGGTGKLLLVQGKRFTRTRPCFHATVRARARHGPGPCSKRPRCGLK